MIKQALDCPGRDSATVTHQMDDTGCRQPHGDEDGDELSESYRTGGLEDVEVLQDIWHSHQSQSSQEPEACTTELDQTSVSI